MTTLKLILFLTLLPLTACQILDEIQKGNLNLSDIVGGDNTNSLPILGPFAAFQQLLVTFQTAADLDLKNKELQSIRDAQIQLGRRDIPQFVIAYPGPLYPDYSPLWYAFRTGIVHKNAQRRGIQLMEYFMVRSELQPLVKFVNGEIDVIVSGLLEPLALPELDNFLNRVNKVFNQEARESLQFNTFLICGYSNGSQGIMSNKYGSMSEIQDDVIHIDGNLAFEYLIQRAMQTSGITGQQLKIEIMNIEQRVADFMAGQLNTIYAQEPLLSSFEQFPGNQRIWGSDQIEGEIVSGLMIRNSVLREYPQVAQVLVESWFQAAQAILNDPYEQLVFLQAMQEATGQSAEVIIYQLFNTSNIFWYQKQVLEFVNSEELKINLGSYLDFLIEREFYQARSEAGIQIDRVVYNNLSHIVSIIDTSFVRNTMEN